MKTLKIVILFFVGGTFLLIACQKETLFPGREISSANYSYPSPPPSPMILPATTKWIKKKADRKMNEIIDTIKQYYYIPQGGLLEMAAYCTNRLDIAAYTGLDYELLTVATEKQDLQRLGINSEQAAILLGAMYFGIKDADGSRHASLDLEEVSKQDPAILVNAIEIFVSQLCIDCIESDILSTDQVTSWIETANQLPLLVSYPDVENRCQYGNGDYKVEVQPAAIKWIKKKAE